jgi:heptosyltransferase-2
VKPRILVIRGGAIGDFILTLPALRLLREAFPDAHLEILGYRHIAALAVGRYYADSARSIEYGPLAGYFARMGTLDPELRGYFGSFQQIISFLFDPDGIFEANLARSSVNHYLAAHTKLDDSDHAARQLARPLERLALYLEDPAARLHLTAEDHAFADTFLREQSEPLLALHPGSGSPRKNWPLTHWRTLIAQLLRDHRHLLIAGGEADAATLEALATEFGPRLLLARDLPLPQLAAVLARCTHFLGHDSGISHLAAAAGTPCTLLFGPTDPRIWAPANSHVCVLAAPDGDLTRLSPPEVAAALPV